MKDDLKKKNVLDLHFQKYLIIASTSTIIAFTYFVGIAIAILTKQIRLNDFVIISFVFIISAGTLGTCAILFYNALFHLKRIPKLVKDI